MKLYQKILLAVDLHPKCDNAAVKKALAIAEETGASLHLIHVIEHIPAYSLGQAYPSIIDLEEEILKEATKELGKLAHKHHIPADKQIIVMGSPKAAIISKAEELKIDLIILGSHGRHGIALLLGSTASSVLSHAPCDVLAVRIKE
ncbi:MAG: universal stress protein [Gammaproteobacteria bacterium]|nr:universal stress protein [Gammaproteobacteria bacterium]